jgi:hypothetical protein
VIPEHDHPEAAVAVGVVTGMSAAFATSASIGPVKAAPRQNLAIDATLGRNMTLPAFG